MFGSTLRICEHRFLSQLLDENSVVVDLGANDGDFAHAVIDRFHCRVVSAEPVPELVERIALDPLLDVQSVAVGGKNQLITLNRFDVRCASVLGPIASDEDTTTETVEMVTLAEFLRRAGLERMDLLKVDTEGAEIDMFAACTDQQLGSATQIAVEFHDFLYPDLAPAVDLVRQRMQDIGFWVIPFSLDNTDVLFLNRKSGVSEIEVAYLRTVIRYGKGIVRRMRRIASKESQAHGKS